MARAPKPPELSVKKSFLRYVFEVIVKVVIIIWLEAQALGFLFYMIWHNISVELREFMFRGYIDVWQNHSRNILPSWFFDIPTWKDPLPWVVIAVLLAAYIWGNKGFPSFNFKVPRYYTERGNDPYTQPHGQSSNPNQSHEHGSEDDFEFDPSAFRGDANQAAIADSKKIQHHSKKERKQRLEALAEHPNTPKNEREIAKQKLKKFHS